MSTSQSNRQASEFRTILSRINEIKTSLQGSDREEVSKKLDEMNDSLRIIEGNQADFSDAMFKAVERMQKSVEDGFKALESRIVALEARLDQSTDSTSALTSPTSSLLRKRKITRHPDLSVSEEPLCTLCLWYSMNFKHNCLVLLSKRTLDRLDAALFLSKFPRSKSFFTRPFTPLGWVGYGMGIIYILVKPIWNVLRQDFLVLTQLISIL